MSAQPHFLSDLASITNEQPVINTPPQQQFTVSGTTDNAQVQGPAPIAPPTTSAPPAPPQAAVPPSTLTVIDPLSRKIEIPRNIILDTKAMHRDGTPSLCMLYMEGRCRQGNDCNQVHADPTIVRSLRQAAADLPTCCQFHGDVNKHMFDKFPNWKGKNLIVDGVAVPIDFVAFTHGLLRSMEGEDGDGQNVAVAPSFVCRLQAGGHCRYSEECKFVHLCREVTAQHLSHCVSPLSTDLERKHRALQVRDAPTKNPHQRKAIFNETPQAPPQQQHLNQEQRLAPQAKPFVPQQQQFFYQQQQQQQQPITLFPQPQSPQQIPQQQQQQQAPPPQYQQAGQTTGGAPTILLAQPQILQHAGAAGAGRTGFCSPTQFVVGGSNLQSPQGLSRNDSGLNSGVASGESSVNNGSTPVQQALATPPGVGVPQQQPQAPPQFIFAPQAAGTGPSPLAAAGGTHQQQQLPQIPPGAQIIYVQHMPQQ